MWTAKVSTMIDAIATCDCCGYEQAFSYEVCGNVDSDNAGAKVEHDMDDAGWYRIAVGGRSSYCFCPDCVERGVVHMRIRGKEGYVPPDKRFLDDEQYEAFKSGVSFEDIFA